MKFYFGYGKNIRLRRGFAVQTDECMYREIRA